MNKKELIDAMAKKTNMTKKETEENLKAFMEVVEETLVAGDSIQLVGFGTFETKKRAAREGRNPRTNEIIKIAASKAPAFKAGKQLKESVNR